jgi:hypothetical protein
MPTGIVRNIAAEQFLPGQPVQITLQGNYPSAMLSRTPCWVGSLQPLETVVATGISPEYFFF